jgi:hypothetical protein
MKFLFNGIPVFLIIILLQACANTSQTDLKKDSSAIDRERHLLTGKLYFFAPEFDSTHLVATGACDCCSADVVFLDDSSFLSIDYCDEGCSYVKGKYQIDDQGLTMNYDSLTVEKFFPETDSSGRSATDYVYNTITHKPDPRSYKRTLFKGRIVFSNDKEFGTIDTGSSATEMMKSVQAQGVWSKLNADPKLVFQKEEEEVNTNLMGSWSLAGEKNASFQILEKTIYFLDQPKKYAYTIQNDSLKIKYENYESAFLVSMKGSDTLIFEGDDRQVYYRFKN